MEARTTTTMYHQVVEDEEEEETERPSATSVKEKNGGFSATAATTTASERLCLSSSFPTAGEGDDGTSRQNRRRRRRQRRRAVVLFSICTVLLFADQNLMAPNLTAIADSFGFDDDERDRKLGGDISLAFWVLGAPASFVVGCLADRCDRTALFAAIVTVGEGACLATAFTKTYAQLYVCRAVTGFSVGGALPLIYSVLGDLYAAQERHAVSAAVAVGMGAGISLGQAIAGFLGPVYGWRLPFVVVSIPELIIAALVLFTVHDPERGAMEESVLRLRRAVVEMTPLECGCRDGDGGVLVVESPSSRTVPPTTRRDTITSSSSNEEEIVQKSTSSLVDIRTACTTFRSLLSTPTLLLALLQGTPGCVPWGIVNTYLNDFLSENRGMTVQSATVTVMMFGAGNFLGMLLGGGGGGTLYRIDKRYPAVLAGVSAIAACFPFWILLNHVDASTAWWYTTAVSLTAGLASGVTGPIIKATLQNVTFPETRGQAFALFNVADDFGRGLGPVFISLLITGMGGRTPAFNLGVLGWAVCGLVNLCVFFTVEKDERRVQETIAATLMRGRFDDDEAEKSSFSSDDSNGSDDALFRQSQPSLPRRRSNPFAVEPEEEHFALEAK
jgi:MFS family permease